MESDTTWDMLEGLDELDHRVVHALQIDGRAPFRRIGEVLGVSDQTVARRYGRLRTSGMLRVVGLTDPHRIGVTPWFVRVRCTPDAAASVSEALARRTDTRWVSLISGGTEIFCLVQAALSQGDDSLLLQKLPRTPRVVQVTAQAMLHVFFGQDLSPVTKAGWLSADEARALAVEDAQAPAPESTAPFPLAPDDQPLLDALAVDGRTPAAELAEVTGWSQTTVRRRMSELRAAGVLYYDLDFARRALQPALRTGLWLEVEPAHLAEVGAALAAHHEIAFAAATTGTANVYASVNCQDASALYRYLTGPVAELPGIRRAETSPLHRTIKGASPLPAPSARTRLADADRT
ncbi:Lrp/AsnC family transcriptional regulator [Streptomyces sp. CBMA29]|uniref:Lrp/AsnC family transcriptional regulator n=1 Tax=Streptomyces sp. CBMA29 TaxID=1896314 RepID=UPI001661A395|nr:Lrp/AsnC family transcriptional regulator [Streptomyces sp. CBMA29]MBD0735477.1 AsnC family transcriptional regulator [Streptomyces sp. CBMA29]